MNKKMVGKFKDKTNGVPISEFVGLKSKMHCFTLGNTTTRTAKGIKKAVAKREVMLWQYKEALGGMACTVKQTMIQSRSHRICTVSATKNALSGYDDKRWICGGGVTTRAHGHHLNRCGSIHGAKTFGSLCLGELGGIKLTDTILSHARLWKHAAPALIFDKFPEVFPSFAVQHFPRFNQLFHEHRDI
jgi:hypothetical protein